MNERYSINIADIQLCILSDEPEEFVHATVAQLDERVRDLTVKNKRCSKLDAALLCALDSLGEKIKCVKKIRNLEAQISLYEATIRRLKDELDEARAVSAQPVPSDASRDEAAEKLPAAPAEEVAVPEAEDELHAEETPEAEEAQAAPEEVNAAPSPQTIEQIPLAAEAPDAPAPEEASRPAGLHDAKLRQIEELLRRRSEENTAQSAKNTNSAPDSAARNDKLREIEELLRGSGGAKSLTEALHDAIGK